MTASMNIVSPLHARLKIAMPSIKYNNVSIGELPMTNSNDPRDSMNANKQRLMKHLNEYTLFLILERERINKLRQLYQGKSPVVPKKHKQEDTALQFPPRYQCLRDLSAEWFVSELKNHKRVVSFRDSTKEHWTESLDKCTKAFLEDMVHILRDLLREEEDNYKRSSRSSSTHLPRMPSLCSPTNIPTSDNFNSMDHRRSMTITPPASPLTLILPASEDSLLPLQQHARSNHARRKVVDMSDDEIMTLWDTCI